MKYSEYHEQDIEIETLRQLHSAQSFRTLLLDEVVPFWLRHAIDDTHGGVFTCMHDDGTLISQDKYLWSQGRAIWTFAALFNRIDPDPRFLAIARDTAEFVLRHGRDDEGAMLFLVSRSGEPQEGAISAYVDYFVVYGLTELYRATQEERYLSEAIAIFRRAARVTQDPAFDRFAPYARPEGIYRTHGPVMLGLEVAQELAVSAPESDVLRFTEWCLERIMEKHLGPAFPYLLEHLGADDGFENTPAGRAVVPGHTIESMWFVLHQACRLKSPNLARRAIEAIRHHLEAGWDPEYGGLFLGIDCQGRSPWWPHAEKKLWWPHTEGIYALLLVQQLTGATWARDWFARTMAWSMERFPVRGHGEWRQRLDRKGNPVEELIALPVKDPFHLPRTLILAVNLLEGRPSVDVSSLTVQLVNPVGG